MDISNGRNKELSGVPIQYIPDGNYRLEETKAPIGYQKSDVILDNRIRKFQIESIMDGKGQTISQTPFLTREAENAMYINMKMRFLYDLPSAGGPGIYWITLSGTLLMAGAALIVYRQKRKQEVLLKK